MHGVVQPYGVQAKVERVKGVRRSSTRPTASTRSASRRCPVACTPCRRPSRSGARTSPGTSRRRPGRWLVSAPAPTGGRPRPAPGRPRRRRGRHRPRCPAARLRRRHPAPRRGAAGARAAGRLVTGADGGAHGMPRRRRLGGAARRGGADDDARVRAVLPLPGRRAALVDDGRVVSGCNVENASYGVGAVRRVRPGVGSCTSRAAGGSSRSRASTATATSLMPCGRCRQLL